MIPRHRAALGVQKHVYKVMYAAGTRVFEDALKWLEARFGACLLRALPQTTNELAVLQSRICSWDLREQLVISSTGLIVWGPLKSGADFQKDITHGGERKA